MDLNDLKGKVKETLRNTDLDEKVGAAANQMKEKVQGVLDKTDLDEKIKAGADKLREKAADVDTDALLIAGMVLSAVGLVVETAADLQKSAAKKADPGRFVDTGLYRVVRCPNYFGEMLFWTGVFVGGVSALHGVWQWVAALCGYLGIIYVMFGGARRLEMRQNRTYGSDPAYRAYVKKTPIMVPLIPLYSVEKYKWLVA